MTEEEITNLSLKYQILSNYTSLYTEFEFSDKVSEEMKVIIIGDEKNNIIRKKKLTFKYDNEKIDQKLSDLENEINLIKEMDREIAKQGKSVEAVGTKLLSKIEDIKIEQEKEEKGVVSFFKNVGKSIKSIFSSKSNTEISSNDKNNKIKINDKDIVEKIVDTQNFVEGYWDVNEITELVKDKYKKKFNLLKELKDKKIDDRVAITILIIYFISKEHLEHLNELVMIIQKAKNFINNEVKDSYESIIKLIGMK